MYKNLLFLITVFFIQISVTAQEPVLEWERVYETDGYQAVTSARQTQDGGLIFAGTKRLYTHTSRIPEAIWADFPGGSENDILTSATQAANRDFIFAGYTNSLDAQGQDAYVLRYKSWGTLSWYKVMGDTLNEAFYDVKPTSDGGIILCGTSDSFGTGQYDNDFYLVKLDAEGNELWTKIYGGTGSDICRSVEETDDGGFIFAGYTDSFGEGFNDFWLLKTDENGDTTWSKTIGTGSDEKCYEVKQTPDGGYILAGSDDQAFTVVLVKTDANGETEWTSKFGLMQFDVSVDLTLDDGYIIGTRYFGNDWQFYGAKVDLLGNVIWEKNWGGSGDDICFDVAATVDSGFIFTGQSNSFNDGGGNDVWVLKADANGDSVWSQSYGNEETDEHSYSILQTANDDGFVLAGYVFSSNLNDANGLIIRLQSETITEFQDDALLMKTDSNGDTLWTRMYGDSLTDRFRSVNLTSDGGFILSGNSDSYGTGQYDQDFYLMKTDGDGNPIWTKVYGGTGSDICYSGIQTEDGGFVFAGDTDSFGEGLKDFWILKTDANGDTTWSKTIGTASKETCYDVQQTPDGGYILAGSDDNNFYIVLVKLNESGETVWTSNFGLMQFEVAVDQTLDGGFIVGSRYFGSDWQFYGAKVDVDGNLLWEKNWGGAGDDICFDVVSTADSGFIFIGFTDSYGAGSNDIWLLKTDANGDSTWMQTYGGVESDRGFAISQTDDNEFIIAGETYSFGVEESSIYLLKIKTDTATSVREDEDILNQFDLSQNYPNPFNPSTTIKFSIPNSAHVKLDIFNAIGQRVTQLVNSTLTPGEYVASFDASQFSSGVYFYRLNAKTESGQEFRNIKKMLLIK